MIIMSYRNVDKIHCIIPAQFPYPNPAGLYRIRPHSLSPLPIPLCSALLSSPPSSLPLLSLSILLNPSGPEFNALGCPFLLPPPARLVSSRLVSPSIRVVDEPFVTT